MQSPSLLLLPATVTYLVFQCEGGRPFPSGPAEHNRETATENPILVRVTLSGDMTVQSEDQSGGLPLKTAFPRSVDHCVSNLAP